MQSSDLIYIYSITVIKKQEKINSVSNYTKLPFVSFKFLFLAILFLWSLTSLECGIKFLSLQVFDTRDCSHDYGKFQELLLDRHYRALAHQPCVNFQSQHIKKKQSLSFRCKFCNRRVFGKFAKRENFKIAATRFRKRCITAHCMHLSLCSLLICIEFRKVFSGFFNCFSCTFNKFAFTICNFIITWGGPDAHEINV